MNNLLNKEDKILIAGANGLAGNSILISLKKSGYGNPENGGVVNFAVALLNAGRDGRRAISTACIPHSEGENQQCISASEDSSFSSLHTCP